MRARGELLEIRAADLRFTPDEAATYFNEVMLRLGGLGGRTAWQEGDGADPTAGIRAYVESLLQRWPDITTEEGEDSPWADGPLINNASGPIIYFAMTWSMAEEASAFGSELAASHGLVCFDPQMEVLRP